MKKIAIVTLAVALDGEKGYSRFRFLANLLSQYYDVDLVTSTFQHWEKKQRDVKTISGANRLFDVELAYEPGYKKNVDIKRLYSHKIAVKNIIKILENKDYDLIYCIIPDNNMAATVGKYAKKKGIKYVVDIEDLWPEAMEMVSPLPQSINNILLKPFRKDAKIAYECADAFVGTSDEYRDVPKMKYEIYGKPAITVYVGCDLDDFDDGVRAFSNEIEKSSKDFWVTYAGNLGSSYDIPTLIRVAQELYKDYSDIKIKILGGGPLETEFKSIANEKPCYVEFVGYTPYRKMAAYLVKSDVLVNSFVKKAPQSIVTKIGDYLAAGRPMINTLTSPEFRTKVENDGFGVNVEAENIVDLRNTIVNLYNDNVTRIAMGERARTIAESEFNRGVAYLNIKKLIDEQLSV
ncbi:MAG: glycosyltransferase family 4 protein [Agathobacter sp.]